MVLTYFLNGSEMIPVAPIVTGITLVFTFHTHTVFLLYCIVLSLYLKIFSVSF
jgi:hypothetical protein